MANQQTVTGEEIRKVSLDFEQRARATKLESYVTDDESATAAEIIWSRDRIQKLERALTRISRRGDHCSEIADAALCGCGRRECDQCGEDPTSLAGSAS